MMNFVSSYGIRMKHTVCLAFAICLFQNSFHLMESKRRCNPLDWLPSDKLRVYKADLDRV